MGAAGSPGQAVGAVPPPAPSLGRVLPAGGVGGSDRAPEGREGAGGRRPPGAGQGGLEAAERGGAEPRARASGASASSLDTEDTSRHLHGNPDESAGRVGRLVEHPARAAWLAGVERETAAHRERRAVEHERAARRKRNAARLDGFSEGYAKHKARWHVARAKGQRARFDSVRGCEERTQIQMVCTACGLHAEHGTRCRIAIVCVSCRGKIAAQRRGQFARARKVVLHRAGLRGLLNPKRAGGKHSEKLLTVTLPHLREHDVATRIEIVLAAWPLFLKALNAWLREIGESCEWLRHAEWTLGDDAQGHPHIHVWFFGPFLPRDEVIAWWREALVRGGFRVQGGSLALAEALSTLVVDVRAVRNGRVDEGNGIETEVIKYMTKDIIAPGKYVPAETYARVYEGLDGRRPMQASKGFLALGKEELCCPDCGAARSFLVRLREPALDNVSGAFGEPGERWGPWRGCIEAQQAARDGIHPGAGLAAPEASLAGAGSDAVRRGPSRQVGVDETPLGAALRALRDDPGRLFGFDSVFNPGGRRWLGWQAAIHGPGWRKVPS